MKFFSKSKPNYPEFWQKYEESFEQSSPTTFAAARFVSFDTETTGLQPHLDRILSIGGVDIIDGQISIKTEFEYFIKQSIFKENSVEIHGITEHDSRANYSEYEAIQLFIEHIGSAYLVGHHTGFDIRIINTMLFRNGLPKLKNLAFDTARLYKDTQIKTNFSNYLSLRLDDIAEKYHLDQSDRHTAAGDAYLTAIVFLISSHKLMKEKDLSFTDFVKKYAAKVP